MSSVTLAMEQSKEIGACECLKSETNIFEGRSQQISHDKGFWVDHYSNSATSGVGPIEFNVPGSEDLYIDLNSTYIRLFFKILNANDTAIAIADRGKVAPVNLTLHSIFSQVDVFLNDRMITDGSPTYAYRAYLETLLSYGINAKESQLQGALYYKDTTGKMDELTDDNGGWEWRGAFAEQGVELFGKLHCDIFNQDKYLLNAVNLRVKCMRNLNDFVLMYAPGTGSDKKSFKYSISDVSLVVRKVRLASSVRLAHERVLAKYNAKYPINRVLTNVYSIAQGSMNWVKDGLFHGQIPNRVFVATVDATAFNGALSKNPYNFNHNNISSINFYVNEESIAPMNLNFEGNKYATAYVNLFQACHSFGLDWGNDITLEEFANGYTVFAFDTTPDLSDVKTLHRRGNTKLTLKFSTATTKVLCLIIMAEFDNLIQITKERAVIVDFNT